MKKKTNKKEERKIYKDFTLQEYDVFAMDQKCEGALAERRAIVDELQKRRIQMIQLSDYSNLPAQDDSFMHFSRGLAMAIRIIEKMKHYEDRCGCSECGAI